MQIILGLRPHNIFGYTVSAYLVKQETENYFTIIQNILLQDVKAQPYNFTQEQKDIVKLIEDISDKSIYRKFVTKRNVSFTEFFTKLSQDYLNQYILPYVGERLAKIFRLAYWGKIRIFLKAYRYNRVYFDDEVFYSIENAEPVFFFEYDGNQLKYRLELHYKGKTLNIKDSNIEFIINDPCHFILDKRIYHSDNLNCAKLKPFLQKDFITIRTKIEEYFQRFVKNTITNYKVIAKGFDIIDIEPKKMAVLSLEQTISKQWALVLRFQYNNFIFYPHSKEKQIAHLITDNGKFKFIRFSRDMAWEENIIYALKSAGLRPTSKLSIFIVPYDTSSPELRLQKTINWLNKNADLLEKLNITVEQNTDKKYFIQKIDLNFKIERKIDWFDIYATVRFGDFEIPFIELKDNILSGKKELELPDGKIVIIPDEWFAKYKQILLFARKDRNKKHIKLARTHFTLLDEIFQPNIKKSEVAKLIEIFKTKNWQTPQIPSTITAKLRNYQKHGVAWIFTLYKHNFGGCLADDMGLGKTIQTITGIAKAIDDYKQQHSHKTQRLPAYQLSLFTTNGKKPVSLIIVPKSLVHNWINEFRKFAPSYKILSYTGSNRTKWRDRLLEADFVLTSYGVARNDIDFLSRIQFFYIVLDESQYIKNPNSKIYHAVRKLNAKHKLILTGTPIENSLTDLWTQMNFINPGLLGSYKFFKQHYIIPIERSNDSQVRTELKRLISPFILRRTKQEVVRDLPDLIEQTIYCEMTEDQKIIYEAEKSKIRNQILSIYEKGKLKETSIFILRALTRLRQIANHPNILSKSRKFSSGKFEVVSQKIKTVIQEDHKLLIFSSFVKHLEIYRQFIEQNGWKYALLTGESKNRSQIIDYFQNNQDVKIFLISLKVGGVGLNLTAADYVFLLDPWWNPAVEQQAISRAHRIGQDKNVFVYRFITLGTVEEKIQSLQQKKQQLFKEFIDSANLFTYLSEENIVELFT